MKADVRPIALSPWLSPEIRLEIPSWVPDPIVQHVSARYAAAVDRAYQSAFRESDYFDHEDEYDVPRKYRDQLIRDDVLLRERIADLVRDDLTYITWHYLSLVTDRRMKGVWWELSRHDTNGAFLYPVIGIGRDAAMIQLFDTALACRRQHRATTTKAAVDQQRGDYLEKAKGLRDDATEMFLWSPPDQCDERYQYLLATAQAYEDLAGEIYAAESATALERSHDGRARWVAITIGDKLHSTFGKSMYTTTAAITSVILGREIKSRTVQQWLQTKV